MFTFSDLPRKSLIEAGWYPNRNVTIDRYKQAILNDGYILFSSVEKFLSEFGGLHIKIVLKNGAYDLLHFDAMQAVEEVDPLWAYHNYYNRLGHQKICPIGQVHNGHVTLYMNESGKVYGGFDDYLSLIADSGEEAIEAICTNQSFKEIQPYT